MNSNERITLDTLTKRLEELRLQESTARKEGEGVEIAIQSIKRSASSRSPKSGEATAISKELAASLPELMPEIDTDSFPIERLKGMRQLRATIYIAKYYGGVVRPFDVEKILIRSGLMRRTKYSANVASRLLRESGRFEKLATGLYRLNTSKPEKSDKPENITEGKNSTLESSNYPVN